MWGRLSRTMFRELLKISKEEYSQLFWAVFASALLYHLHSNKCFLMLWSHLWFHFVTTASCTDTGHHWKEPCSILCILPSRIYRQKRSPSSLLFFMVNSTSSLSLLTGLVLQYLHHLGAIMSRCSWKGRGEEEGELELDTTLQVCTNTEQRGKITSIAFLVILCLTLTRIPLALLASRVHCWVLFNLISTRTHRFFSEELFSC